MGKRGLEVESSLRVFSQENSTLSRHCDYSHLPFPSSFPKGTSGTTLKMAVLSHNGKSARLWSHGADTLWLN